MIDPCLWEDENFGLLSDKAKILFISCISNADDDGRLSANSSNLRAMAFRFENIALQKIEELISEISINLKNFKAYCVGDKKYIQLMKWEEYQKQRDERRIPSKIPAFVEFSNDVRQMSDKCQTNVSELSDNPPSDVRQMSAQVKLSKVKLSKDKLILYVDFEKSTCDGWNSFCEKYPIISKIEKISDERRLKLKKRFENKHFVDNFHRVLAEIPQSQFLLGENEHKWRVSFDWLIANNTNYVKVLEGKYKTVVSEAEQRKQAEEKMKKIFAGGK